MQAALEGLVVLDLSSYLAGPYGGALLGDVGATVIKVEAPGGEMMRRYPSTLKGENRAFLGANRNKKSIVIDLKNAYGLDTFHMMVEQADVIIHNMRPGVPEALGIDYDTLSALRHDLIYCSLTGYGEAPDGPLRNHPGYDQMLQSFAGVAAAQGESSGAPIILRGSIVDFFTSTLVAFSVASAVVQRLHTGEGQHVEVSLLRSAIALQVGRFISADNEPWDIPKEPDSGRVAQALPTKAGYLYFQASTPKFWTALCEIVGLPEMAADPKYDTLLKRAVHADEIMPKIKDALLTRTALEWEESFQGRVPGVAVRSVSEMFDHPQVTAEGLITTLEHPVVGRYQSMTTAVKMGISDVEVTRAPLVAEHTDEVLRSFGFDDDSIDKLRHEGAVS